MTTRMVRTCDQCENEIPKGQPFWRVSQETGKRLPEPVDHEQLVLELCSFKCVTKWAKLHALGGAHNGRG